MKVKVLKIAGVHEALVGLSLSYNVRIRRAAEVATQLWAKDGGHNKFLESIVVWIDMTAPRYFWQQFDTYRVGISKQSESTMHTLTKKHLTQENFSESIPTEWLDHLNELIGENNLGRVKELLPESFMQRRVICINFKALKNIVDQRKTHKLKEWRQFTKLFEEFIPNTLVMGGEI